MSKIVLFATSDLEPVVEEGSKGFVSKQQWVTKMLGSFAGQVRARPLAYRSFGPFWWPLKRLMIEAGEFPGTLPDADEVARISFGRADLDVAAAFAYSEYASANQIEMSTTITVDTEDGDTIDYLLNDDELESTATMATVA